MKAFAFIPARYLSSRFPGKPLALIAGRPMIQHVYERAYACRDLSGVYVATDDDRIAACVEGFGGKAVMTDSAHRSGSDRICEAAHKVGVAGEDIVVNIQGDQPAFHPSVVQQMIQPLMEDPSLPMSTLMWRIQREAEITDPNHVKVVTDKEGFALYFSRSPIPFFRDAHASGAVYKHLGFYAYRMDFLIRFTDLPGGVLEAAEKLEQLRVLEHGFRIRVVETSKDSIEVDVPKDIERVEMVIRGEPIVKALGRAHV